MEVRGTVIRIKGSGDLACVRETVATLMTDAGLSARQAADQLGHSTISMTQDFYRGRTVAASGAKEVLEVFGTTSPPKPTSGGFLGVDLESLPGSLH